MSEPDHVLTVNGVRYVREDTLVNDTSFVIVRCRNAGVHAGELHSRENGVVILKNSRRLWRWWSKFTLSGLATDGPLASKLDKQQYACVLPWLHLTESDVCEVIPCSDRAREAIMAVPEHKND